MNKFRIAFHTLGCRLNQFETESLATQFSDSGYSIVDFDDEADIYILNTCTVTGRSDRKSRNIINRISAKNALTVVTGCFVDACKGNIENSSVDYFIGNSQKQNIFSIVDSHIKGEAFSLPESGVFDFPVSNRIYHTRGTVKIQDGCNNFCSFCIIPFVRGREISMPFGKVIEQVKKTIESGYKEITLTGINISRYKYENITFSHLVEKILEIEGDFRLRITSIEPDNLDDRLIDLFSHQKLCRHLHLCLQSGSESILEKMKRQYCYASYSDFVSRIRGRHPLFNFTTDIMVGFPGETDDDFRKTLDAVSDINFGHVHTFPFSVRKGTPAAKMDNQIPEKIKKDRSEIIRNAAEKEKIKYRKKLLQSPEKILIENDKGEKSGYGEYYVPVVLKNSCASLNDFTDVIISGFDPLTLVLVAEQVSCNPDI